MRRSFFYAVPPAGNRLRLTDVIRCLRSASQDDAARLLGEMLAQHVESQHFLYLSSGRAALWLILRAAAHLKPERQEVVLPAYTCPAIVSAILKVNLKPVLCDLNLADFGYRLEDLDRKICRRTLAVIPVHLFGYASPLEEIIALASHSGTWVFEDAAQAFGNPFVHQPSILPAHRGDAIFFSFGRGKPLSALHGGILVTRSEELGQTAHRIYGTLSESGTWSHLKYSLSFLAYSLFSNPYLYWAPLKLPCLHLGETLFEPSFPIRRGLPAAARVIFMLVDSLRDETETRRRNTAYYTEHLRDLPGLQIPPHPAYPYLRYPLLAHTRNLRDRILNELSARGLAGAAFYPCPLNRLPRLREILQDDAPYPNAQSLAERLVTLPVHSGVADRDLTRVVEAIREACFGSASASERLLAGHSRRRAPAAESQK